MAGDGAPPAAPPQGCGVGDARGGRPACAAEAGFDFFQVHFPVETPEATLAAWSATVGADRLWLAPKLPPGAAFPTTVLEHGRTVLWDTYAKDAYGGTGRTGDWAAFRAAREANTKTNWILAGGLSPGNVAAALAATGARWLDVNSGVESVPGVKDPAKLGAFFAAVRAAASGGPTKRKALAPAAGADSTS
ncbi:MAG: hypothetical protein MZV63_19515 [Marinilabiliales bacterium]|nr:hypothetical protein [Marinilabiliales bacterium]